METVIGKALADLAALAETKWYAAMGLVGLMMFMWVCVAGTPHDDVLIGAIAAAMMFLGFADGETRTKKERIDTRSGYKITIPTRRITVPGVILLTLGAVSLATIPLRVFGYV